MSELDKLGNETARWHLMIEAAKLGAKQAGFALDRLPGRGLSNVWRLFKNGKSSTTSIRTTRDRWIAFPPLENGTKWKTLDSVELVLVSAVDNKDNPTMVDVYLFEASEVRRCFDAAYSARVAVGNIVRDNYGMWVALDAKAPGPANSVGSGLANKHKPIASFSIAALVQSGTGEDAGEGEDTGEDERDGEPEGGFQVAAVSHEAEAPLTISEAKRRLAKTLGVPEASIKISIEA